MSVKLLFVSEALLADDAGGVQKSLATEIDELRSLGYEVRSLCRTHRADSPLHEVVDGLDITRLRSPVKGMKTFYLHPFNTMRNGPAAIEGIYAQWPFDIAYAHSTFFANALAKAKVPARKVFCYHSPAGDEIAIDVAKRKYGALTPAAAIAVKKIIKAEAEAIGAMTTTFARSQYMHDRLRAIHPQFNSIDIPIIPLMVDTERYAFAPGTSEARTRLNLPLERPILLTVRRLVARMGFDQLIKAIVTVKEQFPDVLLLLCGRGYLEGELKQMVTELNLRDNVRFMGYVPDEDLPSFYAACDMFVLPTAELEGFGLVTIEAASTGRLVVGTPVGGSVEVIGSFDPGLLTDGKDSVALSKGILKWLDKARDLNRRQDMRKKCEALYSRSAVTKSLNELMTAALKKEGR